MTQRQLLAEVGRRWPAALALVALAASLAAQAPAPPTQAQVARRFLGEVLRADYRAAYRRLAPEVRAALRPGPFATAAAPLWRQGQRRGPAVELYKLGARLNGRSGQWFYAFAFASDSLRRPPPVLLEVTFRDTTARQVLGFSLRQR